MLWGKDEGYAGSRPETGGKNPSDISASSLMYASLQVHEMTVFEQRRLLRQAADALWNRREKARCSGDVAASGPHDLDHELRSMAEQILRTPRPLIRLAFWEAAQALRDFDRRISMSH